MDGLNSPTSQTLGLFKKPTFLRVKTKLIKSQVPKNIKTGRKWIQMLISSCNCNRNNKNPRMTSLMLFIPMSLLFTARKFCTLLNCLSWQISAFVFPENEKMQSKFCTVQESLRWSLSLHSCTIGALKTAQKFYFISYITAGPVIKIDHNNLVILILQEFWFLHIFNNTESIKIT